MYLIEKQYNIIVDGLVFVKPTNKVAWVTKIDRNFIYTNRGRFKPEDIENPIRVAFNAQLEILELSGKLRKLEKRLAKK